MQTTPSSGTPAAVHLYDLNTVFLSKTIIALAAVFAHADDGDYDLSPLPAQRHDRPRQQPTASSSPSPHADTATPSTAEGGSAPRVTRLPFSAGSAPYTASTLHRATRRVSNRVGAGGLRPKAVLCGADGRWRTARDGAAAPSPPPPPGRGAAHLLLAPLDAYHSLLSFRNVDAVGTPAAEPAAAAAAAATATTTTVLRLSGASPGCRPPRTGICVVRRLEGEQRQQQQQQQEDGAAPSHPTLSHIARGLPLDAFDGWVRDYTVHGLSCNEAVLQAAWEAKMNERGATAVAAPPRVPAGAVVEVSELAVGGAVDGGGDDAEDEATAAVTPHLDGDLASAVSATREGATTTLSPSPDRLQCSSTTTSSTSTPSLSTDRSEASGAATAPQQVLWEEERRRAEHAAAQLRHRFLVSDSAQHAVWALEVRLPSMAVRVVAPSEFFALKEEEEEDDEHRHNGGAEAAPLLPRKRSATAVTRGLAPSSHTPPPQQQQQQQQPRSPSPTDPLVTAAADKSANSGAARASTSTATRRAGESSRRRRRSSASASPSLAMVEAVPVPLMGGSRGFVDGHFSVARFDAPTAMCWRVDEDDAHDPGGDGEPVADVRRRRECAVLFISDAGNHAIRYANFSNRLVRTITGVDGVPGYRDGSCVSSLLRGATALAWCSAGLIFTDGANSVVRLITGVGRRRTSRQRRVEADEDAAVAEGAREGEEEHSSASTEARTAAAAPPRVWTLAGCARAADDDADDDASGADAAAGLASYVDCAAPSRARFGYLSDMAVWTDETGDAQVLLVDQSHHALRILDARTGVSTYVGPLDYDVTSMASPQTAAAATVDALPAGLVSPCSLALGALIKERSPALLSTAPHHRGGGGPATMVTPQPYLCSASPLLFTASAVTGAVSVLLPVPHRSAHTPWRWLEEQQQQQRHRSPTAASRGSEEGAAPDEPDVTPAASAAAAASIRGALELGIATEGRRTIGEAATPSLKHVVVGWTAADDDDDNDDDDSGKGSDCDGDGAETRRAAHRAQRAASAQQGEDYLRLRFPWLLPPSPPVLSTRLVSGCTCHVSGKRRAAAAAAAAAPTHSPSSALSPPLAPQHHNRHLRQQQHQQQQQLLFHTPPRHHSLAAAGVAHPQYTGAVAAAAREVAALLAERPPSHTTTTTAPPLDVVAGGGQGDQGDCRTPSQVTTPPESGIREGASAQPAPEVESRAARGALQWLTPPPQSVSRSPSGSPRGSGSRGHLHQQQQQPTYAERFEQWPPEQRQQRLRNTVAVPIPACASTDTSPAETPRAAHQQQQEQQQRDAVASLGDLKRSPDAVEPVSPPRSPSSTGPSLLMAVLSSPASLSRSPRGHATSPNNSSGRVSPPLTPRAMTAHQLMQRRRPSRSSTAPHAASVEGGRANAPVSLAAPGERVGSALEPVEVTTPGPVLAVAERVVQQQQQQKCVEQLHDAYDAAVRRLFRLYSYLASRTATTTTASGGAGAEGGSQALRRRGAAPPPPTTHRARQTEVHSMTFTAFMRFVILTGYADELADIAVAAAASAAAASSDDGASLLLCRLSQVQQPQRRRRSGASASASAFSLASAPAASDMVVVPLAATDARAIAAVLYMCGVRHHGYHTVAQMNFQGFRRAVLLLHTWARTAAREAGADSAVAHVDAVPSLDALTSEDVVDAYAKVYERAVRGIAALAAAADDDKDDREPPPLHPRPPLASSPPSDADTDGAIWASLASGAVEDLTTPPVSPITAAVATSTAVGGVVAAAAAAAAAAAEDVSCLALAEGHSTNGDAALHGAVGVGSVTPHRGLARHAALAIDDLLRLLQLNDATLRQLFDAYSVPITVHRSPHYEAPRSAAAAAAVSSPCSLLLSSSSPDGSMMLRGGGGGGDMEDATAAAQERQRRWPRRASASAATAASAATVERRSLASSAHPRAASSATADGGAAPCSGAAHSISATQQDLLWKLQQLYTMSALANKEVYERTSHVIRVVPCRQFVDLWRTLDVFPSLLNVAALRQTFCDALTTPLLRGTPPPPPSSSPPARPSAAAWERRTTALLCEHGGLPYACFIESYVRIAFMVFSHDVDRVAYPTATAKAAGLMQWCNKQVTLGLVAKREQQQQRQRAASTTAELRGSRRSSCVPAGDAAAAAWTGPSTSTSAAAAAAARATRVTGTFPERLRLFRVPAATHTE
ncbi:hypothetical protein NESM_000542200 [Novymonas esmeraldas]|uniref:Velvet domain-containing protein n=1 Tax=Novymonas esmeraldas TaxID=1808958 RepID=A0AAW0EQT4_9TRYP